MRMDYCSTTLTEAACLAAVLADGEDMNDQPFLSEMLPDPPGPADAEIDAVFEEIYGPFGTGTDLPF